MFVTSDSEDSISVTSSIESELRDRYALERILAEQVGQDGSPQYLAKWEGYPIERSTWEIEANFDPETLEEWRAKKARELAGLDRPYDIEEHYRKIDEFEAAKAERKERRKKKRRHLRLERLSSERRGDSNPNSLDEHENDSIRLQNTNKRLVKPPRTLLRSRSASTTSESDQPFKVRKPSIPSAKPLHASFSVSSAEPKGNKARQLPVKKANLAKPAVPIRGPPSTKTFLPTRNFNKTPNATTPVLGATFDPASIPKAATSAYSNLKPALRKDRYGALGHGPGRPQRERVQGADVMKNWDIAPRERKRTTARHVDPDNRDPTAKQYGQLSRLNWQKKYLGNEPQPDHKSLQLFDPKDKKLVEKLENVLPARRYTGGVTQEKTPFQKWQDEVKQRALDEGLVGEKATTHNPSVGHDRGELFVDEAVESPIEEDTEMTDAPAMPQLDTRRVSAPQLLKQPLGRPSPPQQMEISSDAMSTPTSKPPMVQRTASGPSGSHTQIQQMTSMRSQEPPRMPPGMDRPPNELFFEQMLGDFGSGPPTKKDEIYRKEDTSDIYGCLSFKGIFASQVIYRGLSRLVGRLFLSNKARSPNHTIKLEQLCSASDYKLHHHDDRKGYYGAGHIVANKYNWRDVEEIDDLLRGAKQGGLYVAEFFILLVYPAGLPDWSFMDGRFGTRERVGSGLRFVLRSKLPHHIEGRVATQNTTHHFLTHVKSSASSETAPLPSPSPSPSSSPSSAQLPTINSEGPLRLPVPSEGQPTHSNSTSRNINILINQPLALHRNQSTSKSEVPPQLPATAEEKPARSNSTSHSIIRSSLPNLHNNPNLASGPVMAAHPDMEPAQIQAALQAALKCDINTWLLLPKGGQIERPVKIFMHYPQHLEDEQKKFKFLLEKVEAFKAKVYDSYSPEEWQMFTARIVKSGIVMIHDLLPYSEIPNLWHVLHTGDYNVFSLNLSQGPTGAYIKKVFPSGQAFVLLDSLVLDNPQHALRILHWFRKSMKAKQPKTWKFVARPKLRSFLLNIIKDRSSDSPKGADPWRKIFDQLDCMAPLTDMDPAEDYETPKDDACYFSPIAISGFDEEAGLGEKRNSKELIARNDELLARTFGRWSFRHAEQHRKFNIILPTVTNSESEEMYTSLAQQWAKSWQHIRVIDAVKFMKREDFDEHEKVWSAIRKKLHGADIKSA